MDEPSRGRERNPSPSRTDQIHCRKKTFPDPEYKDKMERQMKSSAEEKEKLLFIFLVADLCDWTGLIMHMKNNSFSSRNSFRLTRSSNDLIFGVKRFTSYVEENLRDFCSGVFRNRCIGKIRENVSSMQINWSTPEISREVWERMKLFLEDPWFSTKFHRWFQTFKKMKTKEKRKKRIVFSFWRRFFAIVSWGKISFTFRWD